MVDVVLVTEKEFAKGEAAFRAERGVEARPARAAEDELAAAVRAARCRAVIVGIEPYRGKLYEALAANAAGRGAIIARFGVGHDTIDTARARALGIIVTNTPGVLDQSVAEHAIWLMGALARRLAPADARFRTGAFAGEAGVEVSGKTLGVIGFGRIGRLVAAIARRGLGMRVLAAGRRSPSALAAAEGAAIDALRSALSFDAYTDDVDAIIREADIVTLHLPANEATRRFMGAARLASLRRGALLINTARGALVDEVALYDALASGALGGAALDVFEREPYEPAAPDKDLRGLSNVLLTPHVGSNTREANRRMAEAALANIRAFFAGRLSDLTRVDPAP